MTKKILIVEDNDDLIEMYSIKLKEKKYKIQSAQNGIWGLRIAQKKEFNIIIIDISMPEMNGNEMLKEIRKNSKNKHTPIIVLSGSAQEGDIREAKNYGASKYLLKSQVTPSELVKEVEKLMVE